MLAYIPYMDPMGDRNRKICWNIFEETLAITKKLLWHHLPHILPIDEENLPMSKICQQMKKISRSHPSTHQQQESPSEASVEGSDEETFVPSTATPGAEFAFQWR